MLQMITAADKGDIKKTRWDIKRDEMQGNFMKRMKRIMVSQNVEVIKKMEKENKAKHVRIRKTRKSIVHKTRRQEESVITKPIIALIAVAALIIMFNQYQVNTVRSMLGNGAAYGTAGSSGGNDLANINLAELKSTGHTVAAVFPVEDIKTQADAMAIMFPTGTPDYGEELGVSYDDPIGSLGKLSKMYRGLKAEVQQNNPEAWQRFMNLASKPVGISCEFCCGLKAVGIDKNGNSACGCKHNPALLSVALYLSAYTDYSDGAILREVMRWKTLFFPKDMIRLGMTVAGGDTSKLDNLPGMVGGC